MKCKQRRTIFDLFSVYTCQGCKYKREDELIVIGKQTVAIYYISDNCPFAEKDNEYFLSASKKLRLLFKDAIINYEKIMLFFFEEFNAEKYYEVFEKIMDADLSVQVISIK